MSHDGQHASSAPAWRCETVTLPLGATGTQHKIQRWRFGAPGARPKVYMQAGLHADELPGMLVLQKLARRLAEADARGDIQGEVVLVPIANPIGLAQVKGGYMRGRVEEDTDRNFNRGYPDVYSAIKKRVGKALSDDPDANVLAVRSEICRMLDDWTPDEAFETMQKVLFEEAALADIALDLHADNEALLHLYTGAANWPAAKDLAAELDARAVLLSDDSGGRPFDESCGYHWERLAQKYSDHPLPSGCFSTTVELRSNNHVTDEDADRDARALYRFLIRRGVVDGDAGALPRLLCDAAPLRAMQQLRAPVEGLIVYRARLGDHVRKGDLVAEIVPPLSVDAHPVLAETDGLLFARHDQTWAWENKVIGKIAGYEVLASRTGPLLTD